MPLPHISAVRESLADVRNALIDAPWTTNVDLGDIPHVPIHRPTQDAAEAPLSAVDAPAPRTDEAPVDDDPSIIFEIPPELDARLIRDALGRTGGGDFERLNEAIGTDALGWYFPFHYQIAQHGIYLSSKGILQLAAQCFNRKYSDDPTEDLSRKLRYSAHAILRHEAFHFAAECMAANWELATGAPCYIRARTQLRGTAGYVEQEEALANAYMLRGFRWISSVTEGARAAQSLKAYVKKQPVGYNRGPDYVATDRYEFGCRDLAFNYNRQMDLEWFAPRATFDSAALYPNATRIDWRRCPIIILDEGGLMAALGIVPRFIGKVADIAESSVFGRQLAQLGTGYSRKWQATKEKLRQSTSARGLDFKPWKKGGNGCFSVRVDRDVRAHLRNHLATQTWLAEEIGRHDAMGH
ncbi:hypothetical protein JQ615_25355 [Bradyrhizobium jicamae]|uniref:Uncharacterized protein n=1 Tax=Bradyrhizobium jicamae TaxID=280332 RepID=A0ABS5FPN2_9BRAD|nr:hypothetical protein [Bradyrhizobium jicamae]MBR0798719.1 hypothetical protein [Bradyrhizobium jicamae]